MTTPPRRPGYAVAEMEAAASVYRNAGMEPPWERVYKDGRDVTDTLPPEEWPWPWNPSNRPA